MDGRGLVYYNTVTMRKLLRYLKDYRRETVLAPLFKMLEATFELLIPLVVARIIDVGVASGDRAYIVRMCLLMALLGAVGLVSSITAQYFSAKAAVGFAAQIKRALFDKIQRLSFSQLDELGAATMVTRMTSDATQVQTGVNLTLRLLLRSPFIVFGAMIMAFTIDVRSATIFAAVIPLLALVVAGVMLLTIPGYQQVQRRLDDVTTSTRENLTGVRVIRAFGGEAAQVKRFHARNAALTALQERVGKLAAIMNPATYAIINAAVIVLLLTGGMRVDAGAITQGQIVALYNYLSQILVELIKLANLILAITKAIACARRIESVLELPTDANSVLETPASALATKNASPASVKPGIPSDACVAFEQVSFRYAHAERDMLSNITFFARPGEIIGVIGGTGAGKSTLMQLLTGAYPATNGTVSIDGRDVQTYAREELNRKIAVVPQNAQLFTGTIRSNLLWGDPDATDVQLSEAISAAQADDVVSCKAGGLDAPVAQGGKNFSGGQRQRLTIARALVRRPEILVLDDSASALDYATDAALRRAILAISPRPCVFIVSQRTVSIQNADQILVLDDGNLVGTGTHEALFQSCALYREIYDSQFSVKEDAQ